MNNGTKFEFVVGARDRRNDHLLIVPLCGAPRPPLELLAAPDALCDGALTRLVRLGAPSEEVGHLSHSACGGAFARVLVAGLGDRAKLDGARLRTAAGAAARWLIGERISRAALWIDGLAASGVDRAAAEWASGMALAGFRFGELRAADARLVPLVRVRLSSATPAHVERAIPQVREAVCIAESANYARALAHQPANVIHPASLAAEARRLARANRMKCTVFEEPQLRRLGMNGLLAVGAGAAHAARLIRLDYRAAPRKRTTTVLVGKAITFDTGGYSIKPAAGLEGLKFDKCGGTTVLGVMRAAATLRLRCNLIGLIAAAENAISEQAYRPGDILRMASGKTVEVVSTDAEGRLVLADALWYAQEFLRPTALIDVATLTGGVKTALGTVAAGLLSNHDELAAELGESGRRTHERLWRLPLWDDYRELIRGTDSDIRNSAGKPEAHCIVGGIFLKEFVRDDVPWAHLDIANVATRENGDTKGATGFGVRLLVDYLQRRSA